MRIMNWLNSEKYYDYPKPLRKHKYKFIFCMLILSIISFAVFYVGINAQSILMAFQKLVDVDGGKKVYEWSFDNFKRFFKDITGDPSASSSLLLAFKNSMLLYVVGNLFGIPMGCIVSYYLWKKIPCHKFFRTVFYLPSILSSVVVVIIYRNIVAPNGLISSIMIKVSGNVLPPLLSQPDTAIWMIVIYNIWTGFAGAYIILTAALWRIPEEITESVRLDGCTAFKEYIYICIPLCWPTLYILILEKIAGLLSGDGPILLLTGGDYDTITLGYWSYKQVILGNQYEYPAAVGVVMTLVVAPIAILSKNLLGRVYSDVEF